MLCSGHLSCSGPGVVPFEVQVAWLLCDISEMGPRKVTVWKIHFFSVLMYFYILIKQE